MTCIAEMVTTDIQNLTIDKFCAEQKRDIQCRKLAAHSHHKNKNTFKPVIFPDGLLQKQQ